MTRRKHIRNERGYFGVGVYHPKAEVNIGTLWRSAYIFGAAFIFTIGRRYKNQASDTLKSYRHVPMFHYESFKEFKSHLPHQARLVCVELAERAISLVNMVHPQQAIYLLGAEDDGIPSKLMSGSQVVQIPSVRERCLNVAVAGSIIMYDRHLKSAVHKT